MSVKWYPQLSLDGSVVDPLDIGRARADRAIALDEGVSRRRHHARLRGDRRYYPDEW